MNNTLYIIGNGFDLNHGLKTSYENFRDEYAVKKNALLNVLEKLYSNRLEQDLWWSNFEEMLGEVDYEHLANSLNGNGKTLGSFISKDFFTYNLSFFFGDWIRKVDDAITSNSITRRNDVDIEAQFFTFNYTTLLEKVYHVNNNNVWHIHKSIRDLRNDERSLIVGHDSSFAELMNYIKNSGVINKLPNSFINNVNQQIEKGAKKVNNRIEQNRKDFLKYAEIKHYIIMGFSMNKIDLPYIQEIIRANNNITEADWTIYCHTKGEDTMLKEKLMTLGINEKNIKEPVYW